MKTITLQQPWASLVGRGKNIETRSWSTPYRGPLAIHASQKPKGAKWDELEMMFAELDEALEYAGFVHPDELPFGCVVAVATLDDCRSTGNDYSPHCSENERYYDAGYGNAEWVRQVYQEHIRGCSEEFLLGDYKPRRFGWFLSGFQTLAQPIPYRGALGLWDLPDELILPHLKGASQ